MRRYYGIVVAVIALLVVVLAVANQEEPVADDTGGVVIDVPTDTGDLPTHGNDPLPPPDPSRVPQLGREVAWPCEGTGTDGQRVQWIYAHAGNGNLAANRPTLEAIARKVQGTFLASAQIQGGSRLVRYVTGPDCSLSILDVRVSQQALSSFGAYIDELQAQGFDRPDRKYQSWVEASAYCGIGTVRNDDRPGSNNPSNSGPDYGRSDRQCWNYAEAHELVHNLGGVQNSAPNATGGFHCNDERDNMCYPDGAERDRMRTVCAEQAAEDRLDCRNDDYFSVAPVPGSYLATHWNVADSQFLVTGPSPTTGPPPTTVPPTTRPPATTTSSTTSTTLGQGRTATSQSFVPDRLRVGQRFEWVANIRGRDPQCAGIGDTGVVEFYLSGQLVERVIANAGVAKLRITLNERDRYTFRARFAGDAQCAPSSDSDRKRVS